MRLPLRLPVALLALALAAAGCASTPADPPTSSTPTSAPVPSHTMPQTVDVALEGTAFVNDTVTIYEGDTVRWTHRDGTTPHNVASDSPAFDSNPNCKPPVGLPLSQVCMVEGDRFAYKFTAAGDVGYRCDLHSGMVGTIHVLPHPSA